MKEILAVIRMNMMNRTKEALSEAGVASLTATECLGRGKGLVDFKVLKGAEQGYEEAIAQLGSGQRLIPKRLLIMVVPNRLVPKVVKTLISVNRTGKPGDGKIFVLPVEDAVRIRTGENGDGVLDD
ncbi:P-II family nitrogen regulator [Spirochaeta thermophila]|uniref:Transcriptional regulatory protein n=1 Tax=Winmispira thermophila (strain ATCC 49972 / DSM 6192 / RI 19.B1) TaxID=665571 RepID=E0RPD0_WINT6|nr:P-II family nitrogen regulator [Spirochaeta thermophila]ADN01324.1 transcriptional regulatory protein [Spirochaeta thermophila DSM 6192]